MAENTIEELEKTLDGEALKCLHETLEKYEKMYVSSGETLNRYVDEDGKGFYITRHGDGYMHLVMFEPREKCEQGDMAVILYRPDKTKELEVFWAGALIISRRIGYLPDGKTVDYDLWEDGLSGERYKGTYKERHADGTLRKQETYSAKTYKVEKFSEDGEIRESEISYKINETGDAIQDGWEYKFDKQNCVASAKHFTDGVEDTVTYLAREYVAKRKEEKLAKLEGKPKIKRVAEKVFGSKALNDLDVKIAARRIKKSRGE
ncbi:MAG: hypothetical protein IJS26_05705 [Alphaproteobacteria bacterium]|nr:hypothetical protein [Alphaproteobacteria bacterium]